jgi:hypothetical protein
MCLINKPQEIRNPNPRRTEIAELPTDFATLGVSFIANPFSQTPHAHSQAV